jgi:hypothetical protein
MSDPHPEARDRGLTRSARVTAATVAGGLALTGAFSVVAAKAFSGADAPAEQVDQTTPADGGFGPITANDAAPTADTPASSENTSTETTTAAVPGVPSLDTTPTTTAESTATVATSAVPAPPRPRPRRQPSVNSGGS